MDPSTFLIDELSPRDREYFHQHKIRCFKQGKLEQPLIHSFKDPRLSVDLQQALERSGFLTPTPIQAISISAIMDQQDFVGISKAGSGKTLAFLVPIIKKLQDMAHLIVNQDGPVRPYCLILTPTRELAQQIHQVISDLNILKSVCLYGGQPNKVQQVHSLMSIRPPIVVGCPGRVMDLMRDLALELRTLRYLVLDEADRMLDMGFKAQMSEIISTTSPQRQTLLFSATFDQKVRSISLGYMDNDRIEVSIDDIDKRGNSNITQRIFICSTYNERRNLLKETLKEFAGYKILIFCNKKSLCETFVYLAQSYGLKSNSFHGDKSQFERNQIIRDFASSKLLILFATDALSRGIDIPDINLVINIEFPNMGCDQYIHRVGRTGRNFTEGLAYTFLTIQEVRANSIGMQKLAHVLRTTGNSIPKGLV